MFPCLDQPLWTQAAQAYGGKQSNRPFLVGGGGGGVESCVPRISPSPVISPPRGQIPRGLALPSRPPFRDLAPHPSQRHSSENILVFRPSCQESFWNMVWQFVWQWICLSQTQSQCCLIFSKVGVDFLVIVYMYMYVNIVLQLRAWFCCVFLILPNLSIVSWVTLVSD